MAKEIILVSIIDGDELNMNYTKAFTDSKKAEDYFISLIKKHFPKDWKYWLDEDFEACLDDGYYDGYYDGRTHFCVYINEVSLED